MTSQRPKHSGPEQIKTDRQTGGTLVKPNPLLKNSVWLPLVIFSVLLWSSAFAAIKLGYEQYRIDTDNPFSIMLFAGMRFALAGVIALVLAALMMKSFPAVPRGSRLKVAVFGIFTTSFHYFLFYLAMARSTGVKMSIISASNGFMIVLIAHVLYKNDRLDRLKTAALILGFVGIVILNLGRSGDLDWAFSWQGDGLMLLATFINALGAFFSKQLTRTVHPGALTGWQLFLGGTVLIAVGLSGGGSVRFSAADWQAQVLVMLWLALISSLAFSIWTLLLQFHPLSRIGIFKTLIPVFGSILSWLILGEQFWSWQNILALSFVVTGILLINRRSVEM